MTFGCNLLSALNSTALTWEQDYGENLHLAETFSQHHGEK
jgi:hypothetical protein